MSRTRKPTYRDNIVPGERVSFLVQVLNRPSHLHTGVVQSINFDARPRPLYRVQVDNSTIRLNLTRAQIDKVVKLT